MELEHELEKALIAIRSEHDAIAATIERLDVGLEKADIQVTETKLVPVT